MSATASGPTKGWVSVWVGDFRSELDIDGYLGDEFERDHGLVKTYDGEYAVHPKSLPLRELLKTFFLAERWIDAVLAAATTKGVTEASCAVVRGHYKHAPTEKAPGPLRFVGCVPL